MTNYSKYGRPISDVTQPVNVYISFYLTQLMSLEEKNQILTTFGWLETKLRKDTDASCGPDLRDAEHGKNSVLNAAFWSRFNDLTPRGLSSRIN
ncbi:hypothetical protein NP493_414g02036 [Ridgeia piscesae]|uniref:Neurotransmitter-gated ion-channel ligand-binding domain-containing protein n=1 Tax=Ridgeia piscesae TaxID=27915 RepID=A0AAD9L0Y7_RIDPI|nr:hypothetical protein NP493_414g02036 [Ridgeia piscesae]